MGCMVYYRITTVVMEIQDVSADVEERGYAVEVVQPLAALHC
jgi:hypothetical protein